MRILFVAPLPPPVTGHSLAARVFLDDLRSAHRIEVVDLGIGSQNDGTVTVRRAIAVAKVLRDIWRKVRASDAVYLTISESAAGNVKDLLIYLLCLGRLSRMYIHLHGGSIRRLLFDEHPVVRRANAAFIRHLAGVIVSGESHVRIFAGMIDRERVHIVPNFAQDHLFLTEQAICDKFAEALPLRVLYMSSMTEAKGCNELARAYVSLGRSSRERVRVDFAGMFESASDETVFRRKIAGVGGIRYRGIVDEVQKQELFSRAHVFCLPTSMFEGQPISILEAYASGCVVLSTGQDGVRDVFRDRLNGFEIQAGSAESIVGVLERMISEPGQLLPIALRNRRIAGSEFTTARYNATLRGIVEGVGR